MAALTITCFVELCDAPVWLVTYSSRILYYCQHDNTFWMVERIPKYVSSSALGNVHLVV